MSTEVPISEIAFVNPARPAINLDSEAEVSFIPMADVSESGRWVNRQSKRFGDVQNGYTYFSENDVLFAKITPCTENGKGCIATGVVNGVGFASTEFHVLRAKDTGDPGFIYQWSIYSPLRQKAAAAMTGSAGQQRVPASFFDTYRIHRLERSEQSKVAEVLSTVDRAIEQTGALIAKQQRIKTGLMQDLLTCGIDEHGNLRSERTHRFKESSLGRIPVEWDVVHLGAVSDFVTSGARGWAKYYRQEGAIFLRIGNLTRQHINLRLDDVVCVQTPKSAEGQRTKVMEGDLLLSITADLGIVGVIPASFGDAFVNQHIALARLNKEEVDPRFVGWFFSSRKGQIQFEHHNESGAKAGLNLPTIRGLQLCRPRPEEQRLIARHLDACISVLDAYIRAEQKLHSLKISLMQDLLTGKRRVTALLDKVEEVVV